MVIFQEGEAKVQQQKMQIERSSRLQNKSDHTPCYPSLIFPGPKKKKAEYFSYTSNTGALDVLRKHDLVWSMMKSQLNVAKLPPTRAAYNSLLTDNF